MAQIKDVDYKRVNWVCPYCKTKYFGKCIGLHDYVFYPQYYFCERGCARYFSIDNVDFTMIVENIVNA